MLTVTVAGRLTKDAVLRFTGDGTPVLGFTVAVDVGWGDSKHGVFINCSLWGTRAQKIDAYLKKGKQVSVIGEGDLRTWQTDRSTGSEITCKVWEITMQGGGNPADDGGQSGGGFRQTAAKPAPGADGFVDDDIPF
jgi:single-strand DNA-binding protein